MSKASIMKSVRVMGVMMIMLLGGGGDVANTMAQGHSPGGGGGDMNRVQPTVQLQRGMNLGHWFSQLQGGAKFGAEYVQSKYTARDFELIRLLGFDHVRLPVEPEYLRREDAHGQLNEEALALLEEAIKQLLAHDLAVIVDAHPRKPFKEALFNDPQAVTAAAQWWQALASRLAWTDPGKVCFQLVNEPGGKDGRQWEQIQATLAQAAREGAPQHTLILTSLGYSDVDDLVKMQPIADRNVMYAFHMYRSMVFTHQGAGWGSGLYKQMRRVPYPSSPEAVEPLLAGISNQRSRQLLAEYGQRRFNADSIRSHMQKAQSWADQHGVKLICTEFGVYRPHADPTHRAAWLRDVREAMDAQHIPWSLWFGVVEPGQQNQFVVRRSVLEALNLSHKDLPSWLSIIE